MKPLTLILVIILALFILYMAVIVNGEPFLYCEAVLEVIDYYEIEIGNVVYKSNAQALSNDTYRLKFDLSNVLEGVDETLEVKVRAYNKWGFSEWAEASFNVESLSKPEGLMVK